MPLSSFYFDANSAMKPLFRYVFIFAILIPTAIAVPNPYDVGLTYWLDNSCVGRLELAIAEAKYMAMSAAARLFDGNDALAGDYYQKLWQAPRQLSNGNPNDILFRNELNVSGMPLFLFQLVLHL